MSEIERLRALLWELDKYPRPETDELTLSDVARAVLELADRSAPAPVVRPAIQRKVDKTKKNGLDETQAILRANGMELDEAGNVSTKRRNGADR